MGERPSEMPKECDGAEALKTLYSDDRSHLSVPLAPPGIELMKSGWPWKGSVEFNNVSMRYTSFAPLVLKNVTASVPHGTTLGIVGRTGAFLLKFKSILSAKSMCRTNIPSFLCFSLESDCSLIPPFTYYN